jgi:hypothetical protein
MFENSTSADNPQAGPLQDLAQRQLALLDRLAERSVQVAEDLADAALTAEAPDDKAKLAQALAVTTRSIRLTLAMQTRITEAGERRTQRQAAEASARKHRIEKARDQVETAVLTAFGWEASERYPSPEREKEVLDWLEALPDDILDQRPVGMTIKMICDHAKLPFDVSLFADYPWAVEEQQTRPAFSPYAPIPKRLWERPSRPPDPMSQPP